MYGWAGEILHIDLTKRKIVKEPTKPYIKDYIGGRGINSKLLYDGLKPGIDPLGPDNMLLFGVGPLTGTLAPSSGRTEVASKSPITGFQALTNFGGFFAVELKYAGYDNIAITGRSKEPSYIYIQNESVEIRNASHLWGMDTFKTMDTIQKEVGDIDTRIVTIGPGGENRVRFGCLVHEVGNGAARTGTGAVMGSKNLKAVAVRGTKGVKIAKPKEFFELCKEKHEKLRTLEQFLGEYGGGDLSVYAYMDWALWGNQQSTTPPEFLASDRWRGVPFLEKYKVNSRACSGCPLACMQFINLPDVGVCLQSCQGFIEPVTALKIPDHRISFEFARFCEMMGVDIISTSHVISMAMELYERGILTDKDTDGIPLKWGDREAIMAIANKIVKREGFGNILAEGALKASKEIGKGAEDYAMHTKGLEHFIYDMRAFKGCALDTAVAPSTNMMRALPLEYQYRDAEFEPHAYEVLGLNKEQVEELALKVTGTRKAAIPTEYEGKARAVIYQEYEHTISDMMGICIWATRWLTWYSLDSKDLIELFRACTGVDTATETIFEAAERVRNVERAFDVREGLTRKDETLPKRYFQEPLPSGAYKGQVLDKAKFEQMKDEYYMEHGWNVETGAPTEERLKKLGLDYIIEDLRRHGKIK